MSTITLGTDAQTTLTALAFNPQAAAADFASIAQLILDDLNVAHPIVPGSFIQQGLLFVPNRGILKVLPGDYVGVDAKGWPILVSAYSIAAASDWTHS